MTLTYTLTEKDFLQHQLFSASKTSRIKRQRIRSWLITSASIFVLSFVFYQSSNTVLFNYFLFFGVVTLIFFPLYQRHQYKKHYSKVIADTYKNRFGQTVHITFTESAILTNDISGNSTINLSEIQDVTETKDYFYPKLRSGGHIIIPKSQIGDTVRARANLIQLCEKLNVGYIEDLNWKWK